MEDEIFHQVGDNYKGIFYYEDEPEERYFEFGAHFKYKELYKKLERLIPSNEDRHLNSINDNDKQLFLKNDENKKTLNIQKGFNNENSNLSQQININLNNIYINNDPAIAVNSDITNVQNTLMNILGTNKSRNNVGGFINNNLNNIKSRNKQNDLTYQVQFNNNNNAVNVDFKKISQTNQKIEKINVNNAILEEKNKNDRNSKMSLTGLDNKNQLKSYINKEKDNTFIINKSNSNTNKTVENVKCQNNINNIKSRNVLTNNKSQLLKISDHTKGIINNRQTVEELLRKEQNKSTNKNKININAAIRNNQPLLNNENKMKKLECRKIHITSTKNKDFKEIQSKNDLREIKEKSKNKNENIKKEIPQLKTISGHFIKISKEKTFLKPINNVFIQSIANNSSINANKNSRNLNNKQIDSKSNLKTSTITMNKTKEDIKSTLVKIQNNNQKINVNESNTIINNKESNKLNILGKSGLLINNEKSLKKTIFVKDPIKRTIKIVNNKIDEKNTNTININKKPIQQMVKNINNDKTINKSSSLLMFNKKETYTNNNKNHNVNSNSNKLVNCITESNLKYPTLKNYKSEINFKNEQSRNIKSDDFTSKTLTQNIAVNSKHKNQFSGEHKSTIQEIKINKPLPLNKVIGLKPGSVLSNFSDKTKFSNNSILKTQNSKLQSISTNSQYSQKNRFYQKSILTSNICLDENNVISNLNNVSENKNFSQIKNHNKLTNER